MEMPVTRSNDGVVKTASGLNFLVGIWFILSPWVYGARAGAGGVWNSIIVGIIIAVFAAIRFFSPRSAPGLSWINALLGIWMVISPWVYGYTTNTARMWNSIIFGIIAIILGVWSAVSTRRTTVA